VNRPDPTSVGRATSEAARGWGRHKSAPRALIAGVLSVLLIAAGSAYWLGRTTTRPIRLPDQSRAWIRSGSRVLVAPHFEDTRAVDFTGEMLIRTSIAKQPLRIHVPLLYLSIPGPAALIVTARGDGVAQVEVLSGAVDITRDYPSAWLDMPHVIAGQTAILVRKMDFLEADSTQQRDIPGWTRDYWPPSSAQ
jgi:ferric-dicitrate binding protein FerR (iron transport regulator)